MYLIPQLASGHTGELVVPLNTLTPSTIEYLLLDYNPLSHRVTNYSTTWLPVIVACNRTTPGRASPSPHVILSITKRQAGAAPAGTV